MKLKFTSITLLFVLASPLVIPYCWLQYEKSLVKKEVVNRIAEGIDQDDLVLLKFTKEESLTIIRWEDPGEFEFNQQMFDIVDTQIIGDTIVYSCWWDKEETAIVRELADLGLKTLRSDPQEKGKKEHFTTSLYESAGFPWYYILNGNEIKKRINKTIFFSSLVFPPPTPPPVMC